jgi:hypothetical protein
MSMTPKERAALRRLTQETFETQKGRARGAGKFLLYGLEDLRAFVELQLARPVCPYCQGPYAPATLAIDYKVPIARRGRCILRNLEVCCRDCHALKGVLDAQEFRELLHLIGGWAKPVRQQFLARLRAGSPLVGVELPAVGSLEWFTGAAAPHAPLDHDRRWYKPELLREIEESADEVPER